MNFEFASYLAITVLCFGIGLLFKAIPQIADKWIPVICAFSGMILGAVAFLVGVPDFPANDIINALAVGMWSGLGATGLHQVYKQLAQDNDIPHTEGLRGDED